MMDGCVGGRWKDLLTILKDAKVSPHPGRKSVSWFSGEETHFTPWILQPASTSQMHPSSCNIIVMNRWQTMVSLDLFMRESATYDTVLEIAICNASTFQWFDMNLFVILKCLIKLLMKPTGSIVPQMPLPRIEIDYAVSCDQISCCCPCSNINCNTIHHLNWMNCQDYRKSCVHTGLPRQLNLHWNLEGHENVHVEWETNGWLVQDGLPQHELTQNDPTCADWSCSPTPRWPIWIWIGGH